jgi:GAF domain-containing protein
MPADKPRKTAKKPPVASKGNGSEPSAQLNRRSSKRVNKLFSDIERLAMQQSGDCDGHAEMQSEDQAQVVNIAFPTSLSEDAKVQRELEALRARVHELETQLNNTAKTAIAPVLYEKDQVGFAYKGNKVEPLKILMDELDLEAKSAIRAPLTATGQVIGSMYVEPSSQRAWEPEEANLVNTVAQQASLQIQSLRLLASAERARVEAEEATRRFMHESWASYLDAIHQNERIGYAYDHASVIPYLDEPDREDSFRETV